MTFMSALMPTDAQAPRLLLELSRALKVADLMSESFKTVYTRWSTCNNPNKNIVRDGYYLFYKVPNMIELLTKNPY